MADGKVFVGMQRPDWYEMADKIVANVMCSCGSILQCRQVVREHWQSGHMDVPVHISTEEAYKIQFSLHSSGDNNQHGKVT